MKGARYCRVLCWPLSEQNSSTMLSELHLETAAVVQAASAAISTADPDPQTALRKPLTLAGSSLFLVNVSDLPGLENLGSAKSVVRRAPQVTGGRFRSKRSPVETLFAGYLLRPFSIKKEGQVTASNCLSIWRRLGVVDRISLLFCWNCLIFASAFLVLLCLSWLLIPCVTVVFWTHLSRFTQWTMWVW